LKLFQDLSCGKDTARQFREVARQSCKTDTMQTGGGNALVGNALAFDQRLLHASFAAHPQRVDIQHFSS